MALFGGKKPPPEPRKPRLVKTPENPADNPAHLNAVSEHQGIKIYGCSCDGTVENTRPHSVLMVIRRRIGTPSETKGYYDAANMIINSGESHTRPIKPNNQYHFFIADGESIGAYLGFIQPQPNGK